MDVSYYLSIKLILTTIGSTRTTTRNTRVGGPSGSLQKGVLIGGHHLQKARI